MSDTNQVKQEGQKTIVAFVVGLLVGGLLVWVFSGSSPETTTPAEDTEAGVEDTLETEGTDTTGTTAEDETPAASDAPADSAPAAPAELPVGDGSVEVSDQSADSVVELVGATFPTSEGWIGVREYNDGQLGYLLGVARFSEEQGLVPQEVYLQRSLTAGREYAVVFYRESGDREFSLADDVQIDEVYATFTAQ